MEIVEVGPRDGLQSEATVLPTETKVDLIRQCIAAGARRIEVASFVHPGRVPQMADAEAVVGALPSDDASSYIGLVLNRRGLERALTTKIDEINFVVAATEGYNTHNQGASTSDTMTAIEAMLPEAKGEKKRTSVTISVAFGCPYEGEVAMGRVAALAWRSVAAGADEIALGDTIGAGVPPQVSALIEEVRQAANGVPIRCHFHNTRNTGFANAVAALDAGVEALDAGIGGYGGSPFAPGASGNIATEDLVYLLDRMGVNHGLSVTALVGTALWLAGKLGTPPPSMVTRVGPFPLAAPHTNGKQSRM